MTKEELIELSDLNREDNIKYISSEAQGIAITLDSDRYAPTICKLERAYICGRRKSEEQITELEQKLEQTEKDLADYQFNYPKIKELEQENAELKTRVENQKSFLERIRAKFELGEIDRKEIEGYLESEQLTKAKEIILKLYNAGRDVLMCRAEEKAYDNLSNAINDRSIEQFIKEIEK